MTIEQIVESLIEAKEAYYSGDPIMSDAHFDALEDKLRELDPSNEYFDLVGAPERGAKIKHQFRMRSMQKCNTFEHIQKWYERCRYLSTERMVIQYKLDGLSGTAKFKNGKLQYLATRGNGLEGSDITRHAKALRLSSLIDKREFEIRGELIALRSSDLAENNPDSPLRNVVSGIINRKESEAELKDVLFVPYDVVGIDFRNEKEKTDFLIDNGYNGLMSYEVNIIDELNRAYEDIGKKVRPTLDFEIDGLVIKPFNCELHRKLEDGNEHHPIWATAWKFPAEGQWTTLREIQYETSRLRRLVPVAVVDPIVIGGSTITRCTLNNYKQVVDQKIRIGDELYIEKANDIIPKLIRKRSTPNSQAGSTLLPICKCGSTTLKNIGVHLVCQNNYCSERIVEEITFWVKQIGIENFSGSTVKTLFLEGKLKSISDLYKLTRNSLQGLPGIGESKIANILSELQRTKTMTEQEFLSKLGIPSVGLKAIKKLGIESVKDFREFNDPTYVIGQQIIAWKSDKGNMELLDKLIAVLDLKAELKSKQVSQGIRVCATGKAPMKRDELIALMEASGKYSWIDSVGKETQLLVTDDPGGDSSKLQKARKLGIQVITYDDFLKELK